MLSAFNLEQIDWTQIRPNETPESNLFDTQMVFLKEFFKKLILEKNHQTTKKHEKFPRGQRVQIEFVTGESQEKAQSDQSLS